MFKSAGPSGFPGPSDLCVSSVKPSLMSLADTAGEQQEPHLVWVWGPESLRLQCEQENRSLWGCTIAKHILYPAPGCHLALWGGIWAKPKAWKSWCCLGSRVLDSPAGKAHWPPAAHSWGHSSLSVLLLVLFVWLKMKKLLLCLVIMWAGSSLPTQPESGGDPWVSVTALGQRCRNRALVPGLGLWHLIILTAAFSAEQLPPGHESHWGRILSIKVHFPKLFSWRNSPLPYVIWSLLALYLLMALDWTLRNGFSAEPTASKLIVMLCLICARQVGSFPAHWDRKAVISIKISDLTSTIMKSSKSLARCHRWTDAGGPLPDKFVQIVCLHIII